MTAAPAVDRAGLVLSGQDLLDARSLAALNAVEVVERLGDEGHADDIVNALNTGRLLHSLGWHCGDPDRAYTLPPEQAAWLEYLCRWFSDRLDEPEEHPEAFTAGRLLRGALGREVPG